MKAVKSIAAILAAIFAVALSACTATGDRQRHADAPNATVKKGVCVSRYNADGEAAAQKVTDLGVGWYYTWGTRSANTASGAEFVPMVWGKAQAEDEDALDEIERKYSSGEYARLLTFNEPDLPDQASMTVDEALSYWDRLEEIGIPLSSPAVSYYDKRNGNEWLDDFMRKATLQNKRVDFIAVHLYQSFYSSGAVSDLKDTLTALHDRYGKPIWLTEFGAIDIIERDKHTGAVSPSCTAANARRYIEQATNVLEQCAFVERYAWFVDNFAETGEARPWEAPHTTLYADDDGISETGKAYRAVSSNIPLYLTTEKLDAGTVGKKYAATLYACGGTGDYTFSAAGLPQGLKLSPDGAVSGKPTKSGTFYVKVTVTDSADAARRQSLTETLEIKIK